MFSANRSLHIEGRSRRIKSWTPSCSYGSNVRGDMSYLAIPLIVALAISLLAGLALIVDAVRRAIRKEG